MIADLKPYAEYKESGLPWLGPVPGHWRAVRNGSLFGQRNQTGYAELPILEVSLKTGVRVRDFGKSSTRKQVMSDLGKYKRAAKGDLAYNTMRMWQGALGVCPVDGLVSPAYVVARPHPGVEPQFFAALFRTGDYMAEIDNASRGIVKDRNRLYWDQFKQMLSPCPPLAEQVAIVRFLDWANGRLERTIRAKRKVIALLNEQKQAIIHRAVTRGLDPAVPLKPSGIPWLGDIPKHWEVRRLRQVVVMKPSKSESVDVLRKDGEVTFLPMERVGTSGIIDSSETVSATSVWNGFTYFRRGDVIVAKITPCFENGKGAFLDALPTEVGFGSTEFHVVRPGPRLLGAYLRLITSSSQFLESGTNTMTGSAGQQRVPTDFVKNYMIVLPSVEEQRSILESVNGDASRINAVVSRLNREIELLREYRTRLVADVVTGKLDVREAAARLPEVEEAPTDEPELAGEDETIDDLAEETA